MATCATCATCATRRRGDEATRRRGDEATVDEATVADVVQGCDAVVHAAAVFSFDPGDAATMAGTNARATRLVLDAALAGGCDPVVHLSSTVALVRHGGSGPDLPIGD